MRDQYSSTSDLATITKSSSPDARICRSPHDRQNPYVMVNKDLINDQSISPGCNRLLVWLLSKPDDWEIRTSNLCHEFKAWFGRKKILSLLQEAIAAGYMKREDILERGRRIDCIYYVAESPIYRDDSKNIARESPKRTCVKGTAILSNKRSTDIQSYRGGSAPPPTSKN